MPQNVELPDFRNATSELGALAQLGRGLSGQAIGTARQYGNNALALNNQLATQERQQTTAQRTQDVADFNKLSPALQATLDRVNPGWRQSLSQLQTAAGQANGGAPMIGQFAGSPMLDTLNQSATGAIGRAEQMGPSGLRTLLEQQAMNDLQAGRSLTAGETRDAQQAARAAYSARGQVFSPGAIGAEILGTDAAARAREAQRRQFAGSVQQIGLQEDQANFGNLLQALNAGQGVQGQNQALDTLNFNVQSTNAGNTLAARNADRNFLLQNTQAQQSALSPVMSLLGGRAAVAPTAGANVMSGASNLMSSYAPVLNYGADLFNTNFNAQLGANYANTALANQTEATNQLRSDLNAQRNAQPPGFHYFDGFGISHNSAFCWVARAVFGEQMSRLADGREVPTWKVFRLWLQMRAPRELYEAYGEHGEALAADLSENEAARKSLHPLLQAIVAGYLTHLSTSTADTHAALERLH
ncbi:MAG: hypothetical protein EBR82_25390 [Caulobacteraceae bacterium]|nr:hypothetical protein [Caulobacteraceae bacterium]